MARIGEGEIKRREEKGSSVKRGNRELGKDPEVSDQRKAKEICLLYSVKQ